jgi:hypothetical protein
VEVNTSTRHLALADRRATVDRDRYADPHWLKLVHAPGADLEVRVAEVVG